MGRNGAKQSKSKCTSHTHVPAAKQAFLVVLDTLSAATVMTDFPTQGLLHDQTSLQQIPH